MAFNSKEEASMDDIFTMLKELEQQMLLLKQEIKELKAKKKAHLT